jgi:hypothetical protein
VILPTIEAISERPIAGSRLRRGRLSFLGSVFALCVVTFGSATAQESRDEFWPELDVYWRINAVTRLFFLSAPAINRTDSYGDGQWGAHAEFGILPIFRREFGETYDIDRFRFLRFRVGVVYGSNYKWSTSDYKEWRGILEATVRDLMQYNVMVAVRGRAELRWISGVYSTRYRARVTLDRETVVNTWLTVIPFAMFELYYDTRWDSWSRSVSSIGLGVPILHEFVLEGNYNYQYTRFVEPTYVHAVGITAVVYL